MAVVPLRAVLGVAGAVLVACGGAAPLDALPTVTSTSPPSAAATQHDPAALDAAERGAEALRDGRWREAADAYTRAIALEPSMAEARAGRAQARYELGEYVEALDDVLIALRADDDPGVRLLSGKIRVSLGDTYPALLDFSRAIELDGSLAEAYQHRGDIKYRNGDARGALADYDRAIQLGTSSPAMQNNRANVLADLGRFDEALAAYGLAIEADPDDPVSYVNRASLHVQLGSLTAAADDLDAAAGLTDDPRLHELIDELRREVGEGG